MGNGPSGPFLDVLDLEDRMRSGTTPGPSLGLVELLKKVEQAIGHGFGFDDVVKGFELAAYRAIRVEGSLGGGHAASSLVFAGLDHGLVSIACCPLSSFCPRFPIASQT